MADLIQIKGGSGDVPILQDRELGYKKDEKALYIGTGSENVRLCGKEDVERVNTLITSINGLQETLATINTKIEDITARLVALETPSE